MAWNYAKSITAIKVQIWLSPAPNEHPTKPQFLKLDVPHTPPMLRASRSNKHLTGRWQSG